MEQHQVEQHQTAHQHIMLDVDGLALLDFKKDASSSLLRHHQAVQEADPQRYRAIDVEDDGQQGGESASIECRICQEDDQRGNLEAPCACCGSLKYAHRKCVQRWCNEKGDTMCEICQQPFKSGYTAPVRPVPPQHRQPAPDDLRMWGQQLDFRDPRLIEIAERHILQGYDDHYPVVNASGAACCRSTALILMALLLLRHTLSLSTGRDDEDASTIFMLFLLRAAGFLLPCYIMARIMNILQRRRQRQEWNATRSSSLIESWASFRIPFVSSL